MFVVAGRAPFLVQVVADRTSSSHLSKAHSTDAPRHAVGSKLAWHSSQAAVSASPEAACMTGRLFATNEGLKNALQSPPQLAEPKRFVVVLQE